MMAYGRPSATTLKRVNREMQDIQKEDMGDITLAPLENDMHIWRGSIPGPEGSVYEGGVFQVEVVLPPDYPFSAPKATFKTRIYHMNISEQGNICIDILKHNWSPALSLFKLMLSLSSLLTDPNPRDPLVPSIATEYTRNRQQHDSKARQWTEMYAKPKPVVSAKPATPAPVAAPTPAPSAPRSRRAAAEPSTSRTASSSSRAGPSFRTASSMPIVIDDDSDEQTRATTRSRGKRKRSAATQESAASSSRRSNNATTVLEVPDEEEEARTPATRPKRARMTPSRASAVPSDDVIVIED